MDTSSCPSTGPCSAGCGCCISAIGGFNQYIIQRTLGAENLGEAQTGLAFAAFLKLLVPFIVVISGIAAVILAQRGLLNETALIGSLVLNVAVNAAFPELPFVVRIWIVFVVGLIAAIAVLRIRQHRTRRAR